MTLHPAVSNQSFSRYLVALSRKRYGDEQLPVNDPTSDQGAVIAGCKRCPAELMVGGRDQTESARQVKCLLVLGFYTDAAAETWQNAEASKFDAIYRLPD